MSTLPVRGDRHGRPPNVIRAYSDRDGRLPRVCGYVTQIRCATDGLIVWWRAIPLAIRVL